MKRKLSLLFVLTLVLTLSVIPWSMQTPAAAAAQTTRRNGQVVASTGDCRFGGTFAYWGFFPNESISRYDLPQLGMGYYLDWRANRSSSVPAFIKYLGVLHVDDNMFASTLAGLPALVQANPGQTWIIGNEPEDRNQDKVTPEVYAERFYAYAQVIRADPTAKIGFGTIAMVTPLRLMYLDFAWARLIQLAGSEAAASGLVDIWTPHNFILNEQGGTDENGNPYWGSGIPIGFEARVPNWQALQQVIVDFNDLYNFDLFTARMTAFRQWMKDKGQQNKPLWLTEFGQLAPPESPPGVTYFTVPEAITVDYMLRTMDWLLTTKDANLGLASDENRYVQKFFWYSINDVLTHFGGTLVNPNTLQNTTVGYAWVNYLPPVGSITVTPPDIYPLQITPYITGINPASHETRYRLQVRVRNAVISDHFVDVQVAVKNGAATLASQSGKTARCGGDAVMTFDVKVSNLTPQTLCVDAHPTTLTDVTPANNQLCLPLPQHALFIPKGTR